MNRRGATILEAMIASVIIMFGMVAAMATLLAAARESNLGQNRLQKMMLCDASLQRLHLEDKAALYTRASPTLPSSDPTALAVGAAAWSVDPTALSVTDFSGGAFFEVFPDGTINALDPLTDPRFGGAAPADCSAVPVGVFCRETILSQGVPTWMKQGDGNAIVLPSGVQAVTAWVRVSRRTDELLPAEVEHSMFEVIMR